MRSGQSAPLIIDCQLLRLAPQANWSGQFQQDWYLLDAQERRRATALRQDRDRARYVAAHAQLRRQLGARLDIDPAALRFSTGPHGKPALWTAAGLSPADQPPCHFSLSHSADLACLAIAPVAVGIDLETLRSVPDLAALLPGSCTSEERAALLALDPGDQAQAFLSLWTRKEAALKAWGLGLGLIEPKHLPVALPAFDSGAPEREITLPSAALASADASANSPALAVRTVIRAGAVVSVAAPSQRGLSLRWTDSAD